MNHDPEQSEPDHASDWHWQPHEPSVPPADQPGSRPETMHLVSQGFPARTRRMLLGAALATGLVAGGALVAAAVSGTGDPTSATTESVTEGSGGQPALAGSSGTPTTGPSAPSARPGGPGSDQARPRHEFRMGGPMVPGLPGLRGRAGVLHGELVVPQADGSGTRTVVVQTGTVSAVSSESLTVKSSDGYSARYVVATSTRVLAGSAGIGSVKTGDTVSVTATKSGSTLTAVLVGDRSQRPARDHRSRGNSDPGKSGPAKSGPGNGGQGTDGATKSGSGSA